MRTGFWLIIIAGLFLVGGLLASRTNISNTQARAYEATFTAQPVANQTTSSAPQPVTTGNPANQTVTQTPSEQVAIPEGTTRLPLPEVAPPLGSREAQDVQIDLEIKEVTRAAG